MSMSARFLSVRDAGMRQAVIKEGLAGKSFSQSFGIRVFSRHVMQQTLPPEIVENILKAMEGREKIKPEYADPIAVAMKDWAMSQGATHFTHWFQPLTGAAAEKHDAFIDWSTSDQVLEKFSGKQLIQGEPDASSFPSGGLRSTFEARGYTGWDPTSPVFVWRGGDGVTLCIPSVFFSWTGDVLDNKIPLLRSEQRLRKEVLRLLKMAGIEAGSVNCTCGFEQEYFIVDRALRNLRPDLVMLGKTVFGAPSPKGQELQDHYFGVVKDRILSFMSDFEEAAVQLAIPVKTRHNEVAPAQHEVAPVFEKVSAAVDHNIILMELMRKIAVEHNLSCLHHEKPFAGLNGSGKHCNWSIATDKGLNLLDPSHTNGNDLPFIILLVAILHAVHQHGSLLRASIGSAGNDCRLGGHEAPPAILSVYVGDELERLLTSIENEEKHTFTSNRGNYDFGLANMPELTRDNTDRNRTSPFAFTGNKFEFRAVGASSSPSFPVTVLNAIVGNSLAHLLDEIEQAMKQVSGDNALIKAALPVIRKYCLDSKPVRFSGDNYSEEWIKEAAKRGLENIKKSPEAFDAFILPKTAELFADILTEAELRSRYEIVNENYAHFIHIEANLMLDMFHTQILPAALHQQKEMAKSIAAYEGISSRKKASLDHQKASLDDLAETIEEAIQQAQRLKSERDKALAEGSVSKKAKLLSTVVLDEAAKLRALVDSLEAHVDDTLWPLPKYRELLFLV